MTQTKIITSRDNPLYKRLKALAQSTPQQKKSGQALLEGLHLAGAYLDTGAQPDCCVVTESACHLAETKAILARLDAARIVTLADGLFAGLSSLAHGVGILLLVDKPEPTWPGQVRETCVILDGIQDAGNVGSILRSAAAAGIQRVFCMPGTAFAWSTKVLRAGMGAHFLLAIHESVEAVTLIPCLEVPVTITDSHDANTLYRSDLARPLAWVFGNEGAGISAPWRGVAAQRVTIPQPGGMESLNVAAAAAICLFEQCRQQALDR